MYVFKNMYAMSTGLIFATNSASVSMVQYGRVRSTQTLVIHQWAGPSVIAKLAPDSTPDRAE